MPIRDKLKETRDRMQGAKAAAQKGDLPFTGGFGQAIEDMLGLFGNLRGQARERGDTELERLAARLADRCGFVTRREFEAVRAIAIAARTQAEQLAEQLGRGGTKGQPSARKAAAKPAAAKPGRKAPAKATKTATAKRR